MKIGVDIRPLQTHSGYRGIGRYLYEILNNLPREAYKNEFVFYFDSTLPLPDLIELRFRKSRLIKVKNKKISKIKYVRALFAPHALVNPDPKDVDVFFQAEASFGIPSTVPCVAVFMDLIPMLFKLDHKQMGLKGLKKIKQAIGQSRQNRLYASALESYRNAKNIVSISESSKRDYAEYVNREVASKMIVTPLAISRNILNAPKQKKSDNYLSMLGVKKNRYLLYVGAVDQRKNIKILPLILKKIRKKYPDVKLVVVGKEFGIKKELQKVGWTNAVHSTGTDDYIVAPGYVSDGDLHTLYKNAGLFIFPSLYEGFGLPLLEAMGQSCPVVCFNNSSLPEVVGDGAIVVDSIDQMINTSLEILESPAYRSSIIKKGLVRASRFDWSITAKKTYEVIINAANK